MEKHGLLGKVANVSRAGAAACSPACSAARLCHAGVGRGLQVKQLLRQPQRVAALGERVRVLRAPGGAPRVAGDEAPAVGHAQGCQKAGCHACASSGQQGFNGAPTFWNACSSSRPSASATPGAPGPPSRRRSAKAAVSAAKPDTCAAGVGTREAVGSAQAHSSSGVKGLCCSARRRAGAASSRARLPPCRLGKAPLCRVQAQVRRLGVRQQRCPLAREGGRVLQLRRALRLGLLPDLRAGADAGASEAQRRATGPALPQAQGACKHAGKRQRV